MNAHVNPKMNADNIKRLVRSEIDLANQLQELLQKENDVLSHRSYNELPSITETKMLLVEQLERQAGERSQYVKAFGVKDEQALNDFMDDSDQELSACWSELKYELDMCKRINRINELVVSRSLKATQRVLNIIRGGAAEQDLYGKQGNKLKARAVGSYLSV